MNQPTNLEISITGKKEDVKRAALAAQRRIDSETNSFEESTYEFGDESDFKAKMESVDMFGSYDYNEQEDGTAVFKTEQRSYGCVTEDDIKEIVHDIIKTSPNVEAHIYADITITYPEGNYLCVDMDYVYGKTNAD